MFLHSTLEKMKAATQESLIKLLLPKPLWLEQSLCRATSPACLHLCPHFNELRTHPGWAVGSCPPSLRSEVVHVLFSNTCVQDMRTLPFPGTAALHNSCTAQSVI